MKKVFSKSLAALLSLALTFGMFACVPASYAASSTDNVTVDANAAAAKLQYLTAKSNFTSSLQLTGISEDWLEQNYPHADNLLSLANNGGVTAEVSGAKSTLSTTLPLDYENNSLVTNAGIYGNLTDGHIDGGAYANNTACYGSHWYCYNSLGTITETVKSQANLTFTMAENRNIDAIEIISCNKYDQTICSYELYVSDSKESLYNEENMVGSFDYTGYAQLGEGGRLNTLGTGHAEGQVWSYTGTKPNGKYFGISIIDGASNTGLNNWVYFSQIGVFSNDTIGQNKLTYIGQNVDLPKINNVGASSPFKSTLTVSGITTDYLKENYPAASNLIAAANSGVYNASLTKTEAAGADNISLANITDASIDDGSGTNQGYGTMWYSNSDSVTNSTKPQGYLTFKLSGTKTITDLYIASCYKMYFSLKEYEVYIGNDRDTLYSSANKAAYFNVLGANGTSDTVGKQNLAGNQYSEAQIWKFDNATAPQGSFIGIKIIDSCSSTTFPLMTYIADVGAFDNTVKATTDVESDKLTINTNYEVNLKATNITSDFFTASSLSSNLFKGSYFECLTGENTLIAGSYDDAASMTDGFMDTTAAWAKNESGGNSYYYTYNGLSATVPQGYAIFTLNGSYVIDDLYFMSTWCGWGALSNYELYVGNDKDALFTEDNRVLNYTYTGYSGDATTGKLNTANSNQNSEGQIFTFNGSKKPVGKYVGIKILDAAVRYPTWFYLSEAGAHGTVNTADATAVELSTSGLNDETTIVPTLGSMSGYVGEPFSFSVNVKNGGAATHVYINGNELTADNGVYTIASLAEGMTVTVETNRDSLATTNDVWNGIDLSVNSSTYGTTLWDSDVTIDETAMFYAGRDSIKLLYPVDDVISIRSYNMQTVYYKGEDFNIVNGEIVRTATSKIPSYATPEDIKNLTESGGTDWNGIGAWEKKQYDYQINITYKHSSNWDDANYVKPESKLSELTGFAKKAASGEQTSILVYGDSISVGWNASGVNQPTYSYNGGADASTMQATTARMYPKYGLASMPDWACDSWPVQITNQLKQQFNNDNITLTDRAIGSSASAWASKTQNMDFLIGDTVPDLALIGFGMNESGNTAATQNANTRKIINYIRNINPECSIVLVSAFFPNYANGTDNNLGGQEAGYYELLDEYDNIAVAPVNAVFESMLTAKQPCDYTSNCFNHPNDFGVKTYTATIMSVLSGTPVELNVSSNIDLTPTVDGAAMMGETVEITALEKDGYTFDHWTVDGRIVYTSGNVLSLAMVSAKTVVAIYVADTTEAIHTVKFTDRNGNVLGTFQVADGAVISDNLDDIVAKIPNIYGYIKGANGTMWNADTSAPIYSDTVIKAVYTKDESLKFNVNLTDKSDLTQEQIAFDSKCTATAKNPENFLCWKDSVTGAIISTNPNYTFYVPGEIHLEAVYKESPTDTVVIPTVVLNAAVNYMDCNTSYSAIVTAIAKLPEGAELAEKGIMFTNSTGYAMGADKFKLDTVGLPLIKGTSEKLTTGGYMVTYNNILKGKIRYARAYVTYTLNGNICTEYSDYIAKIDFVG